MAQGTSLLWTVAGISHMETLVDRDTRLRSDELETWLVAQVLVRNIGDRTQRLNEANCAVRYRPTGDSEVVNRITDSEATQVASNQLNVPKIGNFLGSSVRLEEEKRFVLTFRVRRAIDLLELALQGAEAAVDILPLWQRVYRGP